MLPDRLFLIPVFFHIGHVPAEQQPDLSGLTRLCRHRHGQGADFGAVGPWIGVGALPQLTGGEFPPEGGHLIKPAAPVPGFLVKGIGTVGGDDCFAIFGTVGVKGGAGHLYAGAAALPEAPVDQLLLHGIAAGEGQQVPHGPVGGVFHLKGKEGGGDAAVLIIEGDEGVEGLQLTSPGKVSSS